MCRFQRGLWSLAFLIAALGANGVYAMDLSHPFPARSAAQVLHPGPSSGFFKEYDAGVHGQCGPLLSHLDKALQDPDSAVQYSAQLVYGEMYDRAVCVDYSPAKSFEYFKQAAQSGGSNFYAIVGWKYYYGHGVEQSKKKAHEIFKRLLIRSTRMDKGNILQWFQEILREREMPDLLKMGIDWLNETTQTEEGTIALGLSLIDGTGTYYDGTTLPIDTWAARNTLSYLSIHNPKASYYFGIEKLKGTFGDKNRGEGKMHLISSARCGYVPAMIELAHLAKTGDFGTRTSKREAYGWLLMAQRSGANVTDEIKIAKENAGSYYQMTLPNNKWFMPEHSTCK